MLNRIKNSLAFRLPGIYRLILRHIVNSPEKKPLQLTTEYNLVMLCGAVQIDMLNDCLKSIYKKFEKLPHIFVFTDLSVNIKECQRMINWFPSNNIDIIAGVDCLTYHSKHNEELLISFAQANPMGLKMAAILQMVNLGKPILYCDTDVLWFNDPLPEIGKYLKNENINMIMSEDFQPSYDKNLVERASLENLFKAPYYCAGIMVIKKISDEALKTITSLLKIVVQQSDHFSEQTMFAYLNRIEGDNVLDKNQFVLKTDDHLNLKTKRLPRVIARHYIGPVRHLFWRDALWLK